VVVRGGIALGGGSGSPPPLPGGGRRHPADRIDHRVGFSELLPLGTRVTAGEPIALVHAADEAAAERGATALAMHYRITEDRPELTPVIAGLV
jgi:thymidine phosphorylase